MDEEQSQRGYLMRTTSEELEKVRVQMRELEEELTKAREYAAVMANRGQNTRMDTKPVAEADAQNANRNRRLQPWKPALNTPKN